MSQSYEVPTALCSRGRSDASLDLEDLAAWPHMRPTPLWARVISISFATLGAFGDCRRHWQHWFHTATRDIFPFPSSSARSLRWHVSASRRAATTPKSCENICWSRLDAKISVRLGMLGGSFVSFEGARSNTGNTLQQFPEYSETWSDSETRVQKLKSRIQKLGFIKCQSRIQKVSSRMKRLPRVGLRHCQSGIHRSWESEKLSCTHSRVPSQYCAHACQMVSTPTQARIAARSEHMPPKRSDTAHMLAEWSAHPLTCTR